MAASRAPADSLNCAESLISVLVADFDPMTTRLLSADLRRQQDFEVIEFSSASDVSCRSVAFVQSAVMLLCGNARAENSDRLRLLRSIRQRFPELRIVVLFNLLSEELIPELFRAGAKGVFECSDYDSDLLSRCIRCIASGQIWARNEYLEIVMEAFAETAPLRLLSSKGATLLTRRETDVVRLVADGFGNREVAEQLGLSAHTVKNYLFNIFDKLGVSSRAELIMYVLSSRSDSFRTGIDGVPPRGQVTQPGDLRSNSRFAAG